MGIPKFFRWLSERYPLTNQPCASTNVPVMDNLYLDMNGIIHNCTHGNDPNVKLTEEEMIIKIFEYIDRLFKIVQPQKLLFAAVDGCAPRAKMNQQRGRRFKAAKEAAEAAAKQAREGVDADQPKEVFDSNCITPGTPFMARLAAHLKYFFRKKIAENHAWQKPRIILSGHDVPGEGEHKIMEHIRWARRQPGYEPNQRHCFYGLDADLIMLSLVTHEPHFALLREVVSYSAGAKGQPSREVLSNPKKENFLLFQIGLLREYLELELSSPDLEFQFDVEQCIDDFVLVCMLIGNDFLPTLPTLDVNEGALDHILKLYKELLPQWGGHIVEGGRMKPDRLEQLIAALAELELETLQQRADDAEYFENKRARGRSRPAKPALELDEDESMDAALAKLADGNGFAPSRDDQALEEVEEVKEAGATMMSRTARSLIKSENGVQAWKERYYREKLEIDPRDPAAVRKAVEAYVQGLHWVLEYYYRGVVSWSWFYPYHYSPMASDIKDLGSVAVTFEQGQPFTPYQQLLAVLPAASHKLLPGPYQRLMTDPNSPISDFYPLDFVLDGEGKRQDWEAVVVLKFIDTSRLRAAETSVPAQQLTKEEISRNQPGPLLHFMFHPDSRETMFCKSTLPARLPEVRVSRSKCIAVAPHPPLPEGEPGFLPQLLPGTTTGRRNPAGFPTLKTLSVTPCLKKLGVSILGQASKRESLALTLSDAQQEVGLHRAVELAASLVGRRLWIQWPYLLEAEVTAVSDETMEIKGGQTEVEHGSVEKETWMRSAIKLTSDFRKQYGLEIGPCKSVLHVKPCEGLIRQPDNTVQKRFATKSIIYPLQVALGSNPSPDPRLDPGLAGAEEEGHSVGSQRIFLGRAHYGCLAIVLPSQDLPAVGNPSGMTGLRLSVMPAHTSSLTAIQTANRITREFQVQYSPSYQIARLLQLAPRCLTYLTSNVFVHCGGKRYNLGLRIKDVGHQMCVPDYAKQQVQQQGWMYSQMTTSIIKQYKTKFGWVIHAIDNCEDRQDIQAPDALPDYTEEQQEQEVQRVDKWLKQLPVAKRQLVKVAAEVASEQAIRALQNAMAPFATSRLKAIELDNVDPSLLLRPHDASSIPSALTGKAIALGSRVAFVGSSGSPPLASRGTIIGVHEDDYEVLFDSAFPGGNDLQGRCQGNCGMVVAREELLNLKEVYQANAAAHPPGLSVPSKPTLAYKDILQHSEAIQSSNARDSWPNSDRTKRRMSSTELAGDSQPGATNLNRPSQQARERLARKVRDPPGGIAANAKGFTCGRGRPLSPPTSYLPSSSSAQQIAAISKLTQAAGVPTHPAQLSPFMAPSAQLKSADADAAGQDQLSHKVHRAMAAFQSSSQQDLSVSSNGPMASAPIAEPHSQPAPDAAAKSSQAAMNHGGAKLLSMLQKRSLPVKDTTQALKLSQPVQLPVQRSPSTEQPRTGEAAGAALLAMLQKRGASRTPTPQPVLPPKDQAAKPSLQGLGKQAKSLHQAPGTGDTNSSLPQHLEAGGAIQPSKQTQQVGTQDTAANSGGVSNQFLDFWNSISADGLNQRAGQLPQPSEPPADTPNPIQSDSLGKPAQQQVVEPRTNDQDSTGHQNPRRGGNGEKDRLLKILQAASKSSKKPRTPRALPDQDLLSSSAQHNGSPATSGSVSLLRPVAASNAVQSTSTSQQSPADPVSKAGSSQISANSFWSAFGGNKGAPAGGMQSSSHQPAVHMLPAQTAVESRHGQATLGDAVLQAKGDQTPHSTLPATQQAAATGRSATNGAGRTSHDGKRSQRRAQVQPAPGLDQAQKTGNKKGNKMGQQDWMQRLMQPNSYKQAALSGPPAVQGNLPATSAAQSQKLDGMAPQDFSRPPGLAACEVGTRMPGLQSHHTPDAAPIAQVLTRRHGNYEKRDVEGQGSGQAAAERPASGGDPNFGGAYDFSQLWNSLQQQYSGNGGHH